MHAGQPSTSMCLTLVGPSAAVDWPLWDIIYTFVLFDNIFGQFKTTIPHYTLSFSLALSFLSLSLQIYPYLSLSHFFTRTFSLTPISSPTIQFSLSLHFILSYNNLSLSAISFWHIVFCLVLRRMNTCIGKCIELVKSVLPQATHTWHVGLIPKLVIKNWFSTRVFIWV